MLEDYPLARAFGWKDHSDGKIELHVDGFAIFRSENWARRDRERKALEIGREERAEEWLIRPRKRYVGNPASLIPGARDLCGRS